MARKEWHRGWIVLERVLNVKGAVKQEGEQITVLWWLAEVGREWESLASRAREQMCCREVSVIMNKIFIIIWELQAGEGMWEKAVASVCLCTSQFRYLLKCAATLQAGYRQKFNKLLGLALVCSPCLVRHLKWILLARKVSVDWGRVVLCAA